MTTALAGARTVPVELELGSARLSVLRFPALPASGVPVYGTWQLVLVAGGPLMLRGPRGATRLAPGDLVLWDATESFAAAVLMDAGVASRAIALHLPDGSLPLPRQVLRGMAGRRVPADSGPAVLLAQLLEGFAEDADAPGTSQAGWLGRAAVDLALAVLTGPAGPAGGSPESRQTALLRGIKAYIDGHLMDPGLSPVRIARGNHISVRYLHHLFRQEDSTVSRYVRARRLERCRADLGDPVLAGQSVATIRARWGFCDATVFSRAFKRAYGMTPSEYRRGGTGGARCGVAPIA
ncbi:helix-turn-helix domain-containing protein [Streptomyces sp. NPDC049577]|uniref:helix-turn-helix domain-containing protein n=1 Tax=Streptomyces sp. NPDC049577 TaxID=3155153 RepID=UPI003426846D